MTTKIFKISYVTKLVFCMVACGFPIVAIAVQYITPTAQAGYTLFTGQTLNAGADTLSIDGNFSNSTNNFITTSTGTGNVSVLNYNSGNYTWTSTLSGASNLAPIMVQNNGNFSLPSNLTINYTISNSTGFSGVIDLTNGPADGNNVVTNNADINANNTNTSISSIFAMGRLGGGEYSMVNNGNITLSSNAFQGDINGMRMISIDTINPLAFTNNKSISVTTGGVQGSASGIASSALVTTSITNTGTININDSRLSIARGVRHSTNNTAITNTFANTGTITTNASVLSIGGFFFGNIAVTNSGTISATATTGGQSYGMQFSTYNNVSITNNGGTISGGTNSINLDGSGTAALNLNGGTLTGDIAASTNTSITFQSSIAPATTTTNVNGNISGKPTFTINSAAIAVLSGTVDSTLLTVNGSLVNNGNFNINSGMQIAGSGSVTNNAGKTMNVAGNFTGTAGLINNGTLQLNANLSMAGGTLVSNSTGTVVVNGNISLTNNGYTNSGTHYSTISSVTSFDKLTATSNVNLNSGTVQVNVINPFSGTVTILTAPTITTSNTKFVINSNSNIFGASKITNTGTQIQVFSNGYNATSAINSRIGSVLGQIFNSSTKNAGQQQLVNAFTSVSPSNEVFNDWVHQMIPVLNTSQLNVAVQNVIFEKIELRIAGLHEQQLTNIRSGINVGDINAVDLTPNLSMWASSVGSLTNQQPNGDDDGYNAQTGVLLVGWDGKINCANVLGIAAGYSASHVNEFTKEGFINNVQRYHLLAYGTHESNYDGYVDWQITGSLNSNNVNRAINVGGFDFTTHGDFKSYQFAAKINYGKWFDFAESYRVTPLTYMQYAYVNQNSYNEYGSVAALHVATNTNNVLTLGTMLKFAFPLDAWEAIGMRELRAGVSYDVINPQNVTTANFIVGSGTFSAFSTPVRLALQLGAGISFKLMQHLLFEMDYDYEYRSGFTDHVGLLKLRYIF